VSLIRTTALSAVATATINAIVAGAAASVLADAPAAATGEPVGAAQVALVTVAAVVASSIARAVLARALGPARGRTVHLAGATLLGLLSLGSPFVGLDTDRIAAPLVLGLLHVTTTVGALVAAERGTRPTWTWGTDDWTARDFPPDAPVVVHGATSGIGRATTVALLERGVDVVATGRSRSKADELATQAAKLPGRLQTVLGDVTLLDDAVEMGRTASQHGPFAGVVHAAGTLDPRGGPTADGIDKNLAVSWLSRVAVDRQLDLTDDARTVIIAATAAGTTPPRGAVAPRRREDLATGMSAHGQAQLGNDIWAGALRRAGRRATSYGPGAVDTDIRRELPGFANLIRPLFWWSTRVPEDTAQDVVRLLLDRDLLPTDFADRDGPFEHTGPATESTVQIDVLALIDTVLPNDDRHGARSE